MTAIDMVRARLLAPAGIDLPDLSYTLANFAATGADLADLYLERVRTRRWRLEDGRVTAGGFGIEQGVGARLVHRGRVAFAHSASMDKAALADLAGAVRALHRHGDGDRHAQGVALSPAPASHDLYPFLDAVDDAGPGEWIALLERVDVIARAVDPRVVRVEANVMVADQVVLVCDIDGRLAADVRPAVRLHANVVAEQAGRRARGQAGLGGRHGLDELDAAAVDRCVRRAVRIALTNLDARPAPAGSLPVVLAPGYPGVLFHEAVGHGLEGDHHRKRLSAFTGRVGERVAAPGVTVIDDGGLPGKLGSLGIDDEGAAAERTVLIEDGVLSGLMQDRLNAGLMNARPTGNGRRQSYAHLPMPRMTNTFLAAGHDDPAEILTSVRHGIYATEFGGGQVDITSGRFNFTTSEAWLIEDGRITAPLAGATLIGVGHEALKAISMVGTDLAHDAGEAICGKAGQTVDVSVGQPTIRIDAITVGGTGG